MRREAGWLSREELSSQALVVFDELSGVVDGWALDEEHPAPSPDPRPLLDPPHTNRVLLIDGDRGAGKTTILLSLLRSWDARCEPKDKSLWPGGIAEVRRAAPLVIPTEVIDLHTLGDATTVELVVAAALDRQRKRVVIAHEEVAPPRWQAPRPDDLPSLSERWRALVRAVTARSTFDPKDRKGQDPDLFAEELSTEGLEAMVVQRAFRHYVDRLLYHLRQRFPASLLVVPIDDADMQPRLLPSLMRAMRMLYHPRVAYLLTGNSSLFYDTLRAENGRIGVRVYDRVIPPDQRFSLGDRHWDPLAFAPPSADRPQSMGDLLADVRVEPVLRPTGEPSPKTLGALLGDIVSVRLIREALDRAKVDGAAPRLLIAVGRGLAHRADLLDAAEALGWPRPVPLSDPVPADQARLAGGGVLVLVEPTAHDPGLASLLPFVGAEWGTRIVVVAPTDVSLGAPFTYHIHDRFPGEAFLCGTLVSPVQGRKVALGTLRDLYDLALQLRGSATPYTHACFVARRQVELAVGLDDEAHRRLREMLGDRRLDLTGITWSRAQEATYSTTVDVVEELEVRIVASLPHRLDAALLGAGRNGGPAPLGAALSAALEAVWDAAVGEPGVEVLEGSTAQIFAGLLRTEVTLEDGAVVTLPWPLPEWRRFWAWHLVIQQVEAAVASQRQVASVDLLPLALELLGPETSRGLAPKLGPLAAPEAGAGRQGSAALLAWLESTSHRADPATRRIGLAHAFSRAGLDLSRAVRLDRELRRRMPDHPWYVRVDPPVTFDERLKAMLVGAGYSDLHTRVRRSLLQALTERDLPATVTELAAMEPAQARAELVRHAFSPDERPLVQLGELPAPKIVSRGAWVLLDGTSSSTFAVSVPGLDAKSVLGRLLVRLEWDRAASSAGLPHLASRGAFPIRDGLEWPIPRLRKLSHLEELLEAWNMCVELAKDQEELARALIFLSARLIGTADDAPIAVEHVPPWPEVAGYVREVLDHGTPAARTWGVDLRRLFGGLPAGAQEALARFGPAKTKKPRRRPETS